MSFYGNGSEASTERPGVENLRGDRKGAGILGSFLTDLLKSAAIGAMKDISEASPFETALNQLGNQVTAMRRELERERDVERLRKTDKLDDDAKGYIAEAARRAVEALRITSDALYDYWGKLPSPTKPTPGYIDETLRIGELGDKLDASIRKVETLVAEVYPVRDEQQVGG